MSEVPKNVFIYSHDAEFRKELIESLRRILPYNIRAEEPTLQNLEENDVVLMDVALSSDDFRFPSLEKVRCLRKEGFKGSFVFLTYDSKSWLLKLNERKMEDVYEEYLSKMMGVIRCPIAAQGKVKAPFELTKLRSEMEKSLGEKPPNFDCFITCGSWRSIPPHEEIGSDFLQWCYMIIDDMVAKPEKVVFPNHVEREFFLETNEGEEFYKLVDGIHKTFKGTLLLRDTSFLCNLIRHEPGTGEVWIKDAEARIEKLDFILLDIIFDQEVSMDVKIIPLIRSFSEVPIFMLTAASEYGHGARDAGRFYYPVRALRLGAQGYFDKTELMVNTGRIDSIRKDIEDYLLNSHWEREYHERFAQPKGTEDFITGDLELFKECFEEKEDGEKEKSYRYIVRKLFDGFDEVKILASPSHGVGSADKFFVQPIRAGTPYNVKLIKVGPTCDLLFEKKNFDEIVDGYIDSFIGRVQGERIDADLYSGIVYTAVGYKDEYQKGPDYYPKPLQDFIVKHIPLVDGSKKIQNALAFLFDRILAGLYADRRRESKSVLKEYYHILPPLATFEEVKRQETDRLTTFCVNAMDKSTLEELKNGRTIKLKGHISKWKPSGRKMNLEIFDSNKKVKVILKQVLRDPRLRYGKEIEIPVRLLEKDFWVVDTLCKLKKKAIAGETEKTELSQEKREIRDADKVKEILERQRYRELTEHGFNLDKICCKDPLDVLEKLLTGTDVEMDMTISTTHGDLNLGNVLVSDLESERKSERPVFWLIDFAYTQRDRHLAFDFAKLETEIKTHIVSRNLLNFWLEREMQSSVKSRQEVQERVLKMYQRFEKKLMSYSLNGGENPIVKGEEFYQYIPLRNLFDTICFIRKKALEADITADEYFMSLFLYSLTTLKFSNLSNPEQHPAAPFPKIVAYIAASVLSKRIEEILQNHKKSKRLPMFDARAV